MTADRKGKGSTRGAIAAALVLLALVAGAWLLFDRFVRVPAEPGPAATIAPPTAVTVDAGIQEKGLRVAMVKGDVRRGAGADDGREWTPVKEGELLAENERLRTESGASAELTVDDASSIVVNESSEVGVVELSDAVNRLKLVRGRVTADSPAGGKRRVRIEGQAGQSASSNGGRFSVLATGDAFTVASERGTVNLESAGSVVAVGEGQQASAAAGVTPLSAAPIPVAVLLLATRGNEDCSEIKGTAPVGAEVQIEDALTAVDTRGRFAVKLKKVQGRTSVTVRTRDASGQVQERVVKCSSGTESGEVSGIAIKRWHKNPKK